MVTETKICRQCGRVLKMNKYGKWCVNGCQIYTAQPVGEEYVLPSGAGKDDTDTVVRKGGIGGIRREPTNKE